MRRRQGGIARQLPLLAIIGSLIVGTSSGVLVTLATVGFGSTTTILITTTSTESIAYSGQASSSSNSLFSSGGVIIDASPSVIQVTISGDTFSPQEIVVVIGVNNTVMWINGDTDVHTATGTNVKFDSGMLNPGQSYQYTFRTPGTYDYDCTIHPWMTGIVIVKSG